MRVLVTGGAGFIGSTLVDRLTRGGHRVTVLDDLSTGSLAHLAGSPARFVEGSVTDAGLVRRLVGEADAVAHLAAIGSVPASVEDPVRTHRTNVDGTLQVLEAARAPDRERARHVVLASSSAVYGTNPTTRKRETDWTCPVSPYAASKLAAESYLLAHQRSYGLPATAFRFFNVYGARQDADHPYAAVVPRFLDAALRGAPVEIHGDGGQSRDFVHVDVVASVLERTLTHRVTHDGPINLARGRGTTLLELLDHLAMALRHAPERVHTGPRAGDVRDSRADVELLRSLFPDVEDIDLADGLARTLAWFRERAPLRDATAAPGPAATRRRPAPASAR